MPQPPKPLYKPSQSFLETRKKTPSTAGALVFTLLRLADLPLQFWLLSHYKGANILATIGLRTTSQISPYEFLGLSPYNALIFLFAIGSAAKQIFWVLRINQQNFTPSFAAMIAAYNTVLNSINTLLAQSSLSRCPGSAPRGNSPALVAGVVLYVMGLFVEWYSEIQRRDFKAKPANAGKPYSGGLFGLARNINYGGYTLWRTGYSLVCGGWIPGVLAAAWFSADFCLRAIPSLDAYCAERYGRQWDAVRDKVPYRLLPWIY